MKVAVMGFGITGQAAVRYAVGCGATVSVSDNGDPSFLERENLEYFRRNGISWEAGGHSYAFLARADLVIVSPGIPTSLPLLGALRQAGIPVLGELAVAAPLLDVPTVAITGTNGKTTVTSLLGHVLKKAGRRVFIGGNIGTPLLDYLCKGQEIDCMLLEVSSFQLERAGAFAPEIGILLNITPDHLDWHGSIDEYVAAKALLFANGRAEDLAIINGDDPYCVKIKKGLKQKVQCFGRSTEMDCRIEEQRVWLGDECYDVAGTSLVGWIGVANTAAVILAARRLGLDRSVIVEGLKSFVPVPHRFQYAGTVAGVEYINDSKATNTGAVIAALDMLPDKKVHLIAGGRHKGEDYRLLRNSVRRKVCRMILIGEAADQIEEALDGICSIFQASSLDEAVQMAANGAEPGETVLLSPACASFDMFTGYGRRGEVFMRLVQSLQEAEIKAKSTVNHD